MLLILSSKHRHATIPLFAGKSGGFAVQALPSFLNVCLLVPTHKGQTIADNIKCYSLPYGSIGFASHLITYYTIFA
jgi:hypothetical protein